MSFKFHLFCCFCYNFISSHCSRKGGPILFFTLRIIFSVHHFISINFLNDFLFHQFVYKVSNDKIRRILSFWKIYFGGTLWYSTDRFNLEYIYFSIVLLFSIDNSCCTSHNHHFHIRARFLGMLPVQFHRAPCLV